MHVEGKTDKKVYRTVMSIRLFVYIFCVSPLLFLHFLRFYSFHHSGIVALFFLFLTTLQFASDLFLCHNLLFVVSIVRADVCVE